MKMLLLGSLLLSMVFVACRSDPTPSPGVASTVTLIPASATPLPTRTPSNRPAATAFNPSELPTHTPATRVDLLPPTVGDLVKAVLDDRRRFITDVTDDPLRVLNVKQINVALGDGKPGCIIHSSDDNDTSMGFRIVVGNSQQAWIYHALQADNIQYCPNADLITNEGIPLLFDPISESLVENARVNLANRLNVEGRSIQWVDLVAVTWPDTSLGCPVAEGNYTLRPIEGYRIVFMADNELFIYHADGLEVRPCPTEREQLPGPFLQPTDGGDNASPDLLTPALESP